jgi:hypothetical protein
MRGTQGGLAPSGPGSVAEGGESREASGGLWAAAERREKRDQSWVSGCGTAEALSDCTADPLLCRGGERRRE